MKASQALLMMPLMSNQASATHFVATREGMLGVQLFCMTAVMQLGWLALTKAL
jgi:hypothetical protein